MSTRVQSYRIAVNNFLFLDDPSYYDNFPMVGDAFKALLDNEKTEHDFDVFMLCQLVEHFRSFCHCFYDKNQLAEALENFKSSYSGDLSQLFNQVDFHKINPGPEQVGELSEILSKIFKNDWEKYNYSLISFILHQSSKVVLTEAAEAAEVAETEEEADDTDWVDLACAN
jgi:hypothetical protein